MKSHYSSDWPPLLFSEWESTCDTVHMWTQIVGKTRMAIEPLLNHWWNVALYVTPVGLSTSSMPGASSFDAEFDFVAHRLVIRTSEGRALSFPLYARSVADFFEEYMTSLRSLGLDVRINRVPSEFDDLTPYDEDRHHASYETDHVERFHRVLLQSDRVFKEFRRRFVGKCSPVHFFWGSFDLAVTRFSGRRAPVASNADPITREAYSHEVISCGFWPGDRRFKHPAYYSYTAPAPAGLDAHPHWNAQLNEFVLKYDDVRSAQSPESALIDFCQETYEAGANLANWDRAALEREVPAK